MAEELGDNPVLDQEEDMSDKVTILPGYSNNYDACTFCILNEDHTLGNALRWMIMKNPDVEFCGYSAPHPSEAKIHVRVQMYDGLSAISALFQALENLRTVFSSIQEAYEASLKDTSLYIIEQDTDIRANVDAVIEAGDKRRAAIRAEKERKRIEAESVVID